MASSYPIRAVARLTGIPEDTLRAWERRYQAVTPRRSSRGRLYSDKEIQRLVLLRESVEQGHSIGQIATVSDEQLRMLLRKSEDVALEKKSGRETLRKQKPATDEDRSLEGVLAAVGAYDYARAERELGRLATATPNPRDLVHRVAFPLMRIAGERWHEGKFTIAQEHMLTSLLTGLFASMLRLYAPANPQAKVLLATPENEHHGFGILAAAMLTAAGGLGAIHLGTSLPTRDILQAARKTEASAILVGLCGAEPSTAIPVLREIESKAIPRTRLWVGGASARVSKVAAELDWTPLKDFNALERQLGFLGARF
ncbi:MAG: MerR family transcriptional regulator [Candidatus Acidiferrum sp.]|jgi:DNA-binding transcriptional MerR regulator/methylmalonyl-CoA mutase cobalamin-binding subunit